MTGHHPKHHFSVTWDELHRHANALAWKIKDRGKWDVVIGIARGGLIPAVIMARELGIRIVESLAIESYRNYSERGTVAIRKCVHPDIIAVMKDGGKNILIVDDLVDTGTTFKAVRALFPDAFYVTLYSKPQGASMADESFIQVSQDTWVYLPWDIDWTHTYAPPMRQPQGSLD